MLAATRWLESGGDRRPKRGRECLSSTRKWPTRKCKRCPQPAPNRRGTWRNASYPQRCLTAFHLYRACGRIGGLQGSGRSITQVEREDRYRIGWLGRAYHCGNLFRSLGLRVVAVLGAGVGMNRSMQNEYDERAKQDAPGAAPAAFEPHE